MIFGPIFNGVFHWQVMMPPDFNKYILIVLLNRSCIKLRTKKLIPNLACTVHSPPLPYQRVTPRINSDR